MNTPGTWLLAGLVGSGLTFLVMAIGDSFERAVDNLQRRRSWSRSANEFKERMAAESAERKAREKAAADKKPE